METPGGERRIRLDGAVNFRDLGGYETTDGRQTRWGMMFRSDSLAKLTENDLSTISRIGIRQVCDFRSPAEVEKAPDRLPENGVAYLHLPVVSSDFDTVTALERLKKGDTGWLTPTFMIDGYRKNIDTYAGIWGTVVNKLARPESRPLLFHCTAGKDRTGVCAALILSLLRVPEETIIEDHALSNRYFAETVVSINQYLQTLGIDPDIVAPYLTAPKEAIVFILDYIRKQFGDAAGYLRQKGGVSREAITTLTTALLV
ncbi:MAG: tyrosine-protein phosphatase [Thermodesulfobacteriota bacterium]